MRKRSTYRPRPVRVDAHSWVVSGTRSIAGTDAILDCRLKNHSALDAVLKGQATRDQIDILIAAMNMCSGLSRLGVGADWTDEIKAAHTAILTMCRRGIANGQRFVFTGPEMAAVKLAMEVHDAQLESCTVLQMEQALDIVHKDIYYRRATVITGVAA